MAVTCDCASYLISDCLSLLVYKDKAERNKGHRERSCLTLGDICGLEPGLSYEGVGFTLAIVSLSQAVLLGFDRRENLLAWDLRIRHSLGEGERDAGGWEGMGLGCVVDE